MPGTVVSSTIHLEQSHGRPRPKRERRRSSATTTTTTQKRPQFLIGRNGFSIVHQVSLFGPVAPETVEFLQAGEDGLGRIVWCDLHIELGPCVGLY